MRLYKTPLGQWAGTQSDARIFKATHGVGYEQVEVPTDKPSLLAWLNAHEVGGVKPSPVDVAPPVETHAQLMTEDQFEALPLAMQLHLAALALENARSKIRPVGQEG